PSPPQDLPELPSPPFLTDRDQRPKALMPPPRTLACNPIGSVFRVASELLECARARYQRGELEEARETFQRAVQEASDRRVLRESRYWLAETLLRLGKTAEVEKLFLLVIQDDPTSEFAPYAGNAAGWLILEQGDAARALPHFDAVLKRPAPPIVFAYARHGRAVSLYGLKRYAEARDEYAELFRARGALSTTDARALYAEATFWQGETLGRLGEYSDAVTRLKSFATAGATLYKDSGLVRLGWWSRAAGEPQEAVTAYRSLLSTYPRSTEVQWAHVGLVLAYLDLGNYAAAREEARQLDAADRGALSLPTWLIVRRWLADPARQADPARP